MLRNAIVVGLSAAAFWGNVATAWDPYSDFMSGVNRTNDFANARRNLLKPNEVFDADSYCPITHVTGVARGMPDPLSALNAAVRDCVSKGGVPECCEANTSIR